MKKKNQYLKAGLTILISVLVVFTIVKAMPPNSPYLPGETLSPNCAPGDPNCTVLPSLTGTSTVGNIGFYTGTTTLSGDTNLFWDNTNKRLGLGTTTPAYTLDINGTLRVISTSTFSGNVGIGTTAPAYKLDVAGNIRAQTSITAGINVENLTGDKTLTPGVDKMYQFLNPNGANRTIYLATTTANAGDKFIIKNTGPYSTSTYLTIQQGSTLLDYIYARSIREYIFNGTNWVSGDVGTGIYSDSDYNLSIGYNARGYNFGTAVGYNANGYYGLAVGANASGYNYGTAVGSNAVGHTSGVAVGNYAAGYSSGVAVGNNAWGYNNGVAVGYEAKGMRYGVALGHSAGQNIDTSADRYNVLVGAFSGYRLTTGIGNIIMGYQAGYDPTYSPTTGSYNILIGYNAWTPSTTTSNFLNIGGLIFGTNLSTTTNAISTGNVGIGTTTPGYKLDVQGSIRQTNAVNCALSADANGQIICTVSSQRYKTNIQDLDFDIEKFLSLKPRAFDWNTSTINFVPGERGSVGFIAEEVEKVFPELVRYQNGVPEGVKYEILPVYLFKIVKDLILEFTEKVKASLNELGIIIENGIVKIEKLFVREITIDFAQIEKAKINELTSKKFCLEGDDGETICLDKNQVKELLEKSGSQINTNQTLNQSLNEAEQSGNNLQSTTTATTTNSSSIVTSSTESSNSNSTESSSTTTEPSSIESLSTENSNPSIESSVTAP